MAKQNNLNGCINLKIFKLIRKIKEKENYYEK